MRRLAGGLAVIVAVLVVSASPVDAHPLGNFTINHFAGLEVAPDGVRIDYVLDLAEIPTFQERLVNEVPAMDRCRELADGVELSIDGRPVVLSVEGGRIDFLAGQGGLETTRIECRYVAKFDVSNDSARLTFIDRNFEARIGWREITVVGSGVAIVSDLPTESVSDRLTAYPDGATRLDVVLGDMIFTPSDAVPVLGDAAPTSEPDARGTSGDPFVQLIANGDSGLLALVGAIGLAASLGAVHGLAPGHGKTVIAAFLVATKGTRRQAFLLAVAVALSHTLGVFVLGGVTVAASSAFAPERVYPYLQALSATIVVALGVYLVLRSINSRRARTQSNDHHHHDHHDHDHPIHSHGFLPHRHSPRLQALDPSDGPLGWRALALLGLSGGLVPSTSAVVLLLGAVQLERLMLGGVLVLAFGAGMSMALVSVGIGIVMLSRRASGFFDARVFADRMTRLVQPAAGFAVLGVGLYLASRAIASMGSVS